MKSVRFPIAPARHHFLVRRSLGLVSTGALLFVGSMIAMRFAPRPTLTWLGLAGAVLFVFGMRRLVREAGPLTVGENSVRFGTRMLRLSDVQSVELEGARLVITHRQVPQRTDELADPAAAASEIARRAGLRPPRKGGPMRWERRAEEARVEEA